MRVDLASVVPSIGIKYPRTPSSSDARCSCSLHGVVRWAVGQSVVYRLNKAEKCLVKLHVARGDRKIEEDPGEAPQDP